MDGISPADYALRLMRIKASTERFHMLSFEERSVNRSQAMEKLQPMIDKLGQSTTSTADFVASAEASFTQESVNVFPQHAKIIMRLAAEVAGNNRVLGWIAAAKEDTEEYAWLETTETPIPPADIFHGLVDSC
ncbi:hypothetical protein TRIATDRAFT_317822 [Trichoderma atroviride IMI 206040]|uniref:Uncharacterized protein n=2 Tax=Hypocrea atroviridis TaxID=63577 RepID=G9NUE7_HYPAI|nr:uncharacterized protein TRIATDRAFT_317822 [Trichoderma atroviride IMI 206040]EHK45678.1 hypothetical protein TRIATDRAFT_317822 [Trichoderma atroviride IMI 206040]